MKVNAAPLKEEPNIKAAIGEPIKVNIGVANIKLINKFKLFSL